MKRRILTPSIVFTSFLYDISEDDVLCYNLLRFQGLVPNSIITYLVVHGLGATIIAYLMI